MKIALKWIAGIILAVSTLGALIKGDIIAFVFFLLATCICLPPLFDFIQSKLKYTITSPAKWLIVLFGFIVGSGSSSKPPPTLQEPTTQKEEPKKEVVTTEIKGLEGITAKQKTIGDSIQGTIIGKWYESKKVKFAYCLYQNKGKTFLKCIFPNGQSSVEKMTSKAKKGGAIYKYANGGYNDEYFECNNDYLYFFSKEKKCFAIGYQIDTKSNQDDYYNKFLSEKERYISYDNPTPPTIFEEEPKKEVLSVAAPAPEEHHAKKHRNGNCPYEDLQTGKRGGCYYINSHGNKTYVDRSCCD